MSGIFEAKQVICCDMEVLRYLYLCVMEVML